MSEQKRKLASIQVIQELRPIPGADRIEIAQILNWECVVKKGDYKVGDSVVFIEVDSKLPERPEFEFMRERKFKVRTIRLRKQVSQGLVFPLSILPEGRHDIGDDVTEVLGVKNYVKETENEDGPTKDMNVALRFLMNWRWFRKFYGAFNERMNGWPVEFAGPKTDETRIQVAAKLLMEHYEEEWYITEKLDGSSSTFFTYMKRIWGMRRKRFGVCSRNIWLKTENGSKFWAIAKRYCLASGLTAEDGLVSLQGEIIGPSIQGNKYGLSEVDLYVFNVMLNGQKVSLDESKSFCNAHGLKFVPVVQETFVPAVEIGTGKSTQDVVNFMVSLSKGKSALAGRNREGIVVRLKSNPNISFKVINPDFLMEEE